MIKKYSTIDYLPYIYFIIKENCLYIGETQRSPVRRWGSHIYEKGSFSKNLYKHSSYIYFLDTEIFFFSYALFEIEKYIKKPYIKRETQYIEAEIHRLFFKSIINTKYNLISNVIRTDPGNSYNQIKSNEFAKKIFNEFLKEEKTYKNSILGI